MCGSPAMLQVSSKLPRKTSELMQILEMYEAPVPGKCTMLMRSRKRAGFAFIIHPYCPGNVDGIAPHPWRLLAGAVRTPPVVLPVRIVGMPLPSVLRSRTISLPGRRLPRVPELFEEGRAALPLPRVFASLDPSRRSSSIQVP